MKHEVEIDEGVSMMAEQNMMSEVQGLCDIVFRNLEKNEENREENSNRVQMDKDKLKKELEEIDAELR